MAPSTGERSKLMHWYHAHWSTMSPDSRCTDDAFTSAVDDRGRMKAMPNMSMPAHPFLTLGVRGSSLLICRNILFVVKEWPCHCPVLLYYMISMMPLHCVDIWDASTNCWRFKCENVLIHITVMSISCVIYICLLQPVVNFITNSMADNMHKIFYALNDQGTVLQCLRPLKAISSLWACSQRVWITNIFWCWF